MQSRRDERSRLWARHDHERARLDLIIVQARVPRKKKAPAVSGWGFVLRLGPDRKRRPYGSLSRRTGKPRFALPRYTELESPYAFVSAYLAVSPGRPCRPALWGGFRVLQKLGQNTSRTFALQGSLTIARFPARCQSHGGACSARVPRPVRSNSPTNGWQAGAHCSRQAQRSLPQARRAAA